MTAPDSDVDRRGLAVVLLHALLGLLASLSSGCLDSTVQRCSWGLICPKDKVCWRPGKRCVDRAQLQACEGKRDGASCTNSRTGQQLRCRLHACSEQTCGDGIVDAMNDDGIAEACDDGNTQSHDGCSDRCVREDFRWVQLQLTSTALPPARSGAALAFDPRGSKLFLFGGQSSSGALLRDTWVLRLRDDGVQMSGGWEQIAVPVAPSARSASAMVFDQAGTFVLLYGGRDASNKALSDVWRLTGAGGGERWDKLDDGPRLALGSTLVWDSARRRALLVSSDARVWAYEGSSWAPLGSQASSAFDSVACLAYDVARDRLVATTSDAKTTYVFDWASWERLPAAANVDAARAGAACAFDVGARRTVLYGGQASAPSQTLWFDEAWSSPWKAPASGDASLGPRRGHAMVTLGTTGGVLLYGGVDSSGVRRGDVWIGRFELSSALSPCRQQGKPCTAREPCVTFAICGADKLCHPQSQRSCDDGLACTVDRCTAGGGCDHAQKPDWCVLAGAYGPTCYHAGATKPGDACQICDPKVDPAGWTAATDTPCDDHDACTRGDTCQAGVCKGREYRHCDDGLNCTHDSCESNVGCRHSLTSYSCAIDGRCYAPRAKHPGGCATCNPSVSTTSWTLTGTGSCLIGNTCYAPGAKHPGGCAKCDPSRSTTSWTATGNTCFIGGTCYAAGTKRGCKICDPTASTTAWSPTTGGKCDDGNSCTMFDKCVHGVCRGTPIVPCIDTGLG